MRRKELIRAAILAAIFGIAGPLCCQAAGEAGATAATATATAGKPKITDVIIRQLISEPKPKFRLAILGENLGDNTDTTDVIFDPKDPRQAVERHVISVTPQEVDVEATAPVGAVINRVQVVVAGKGTAETKGLTISIKPSPPAPKLKTFEIKLDPQKSTEFPNLHSLLITKASGDPGVGFATNPHRMEVTIEPAGASEQRIVQSNEQQLELRFLAATDYQPKTAIVTVFDSSDLDFRQPVAVAKMAPAEPPADPNQPEISNVDIVFINRSEGNGRIRIHGKNFGSYPPHDFGSADDFLCQCLERPKVAKVEGKERQACGYENRKANEKPCSERLPAWNKWQAAIGGNISAGLVPRNETLRVEKVVVLQANDELVDLYFEFTRHQHFAEPFRLASVDLTIQKNIEDVKQTLTAGAVTMVIEAFVPKVFSVQKGIGLSRSPDLIYRYTVLSQDAAHQILGEGVANNFYVLQLSVVNNGAKKVLIPLAAIQVEAEWARGSETVKSGNGKTEETDQAGEENGEIVRSYLEGPPTLSPIPLAVVAGYFNAYDKSIGRRARLFNIFNGITTLATALVPFTGPAVKDGLIIFNGGIVPGVRQGWGDLSGQQLQNLTALSWETTETLAAHGGSMERLVYIQRSAQFEGGNVTLAGVPQSSAKSITSILDLEITGYEVIESKTQDGTPATNPAAPASTGTATPGTSTSTTASTPSTPGN